MIRSRFKGGLNVFRVNGNGINNVPWGGSGFVFTETHQESRRRDAKTCLIAISTGANCDRIASASFSNNVSTGHGQNDAVHHGFARTFSQELVHGAVDTEIVRFRWQWICY